MKRVHEETVSRTVNVATVRGGRGYNRPGEVQCYLENTGNGYIAHFPSHSSTHQDHYITLDYAQAYDLVLALSAFKKELGFV
jgi:hypothetical protein